MRKTTLDQIKRQSLNYLFRPVASSGGDYEPVSRYSLADVSSICDPSKDAGSPDDELAVARYDRATFWPAQSVAWRDGRLASATFLDVERRLLLERMSALRKYPVIKHDGWATSIECVYPSSNYYHFFVDILPRVWALRNPVFQSAEITLYYTRPLSQEHEDILRDLLPTSVKLRKVRAFSRVQCDCYLHLPYLSRSQGSTDGLTPTSAGFIPRAYLDWFRAYMLGRYDVAREAPERLIYVSRRRSKQRRIINDAEVSEFLRTLGFEIIVLEELTIAEQVAIFASARAVVAQHGAGLTNLLYMRGGALVEIFSSRHFFRHYAQYAESTGMHYERVHMDRPWKHADIELPVSVLEAPVKRALRSSGISAAAI